MQSGIWNCDYCPYFWMIQSRLFHKHGKYLDLFETPLFVLNMSDTFQTNYKSASNIIKNINSIFAAIKENTNLSETQKQLGRVKQYYGQAQEALKIMRNTASTMTYNNKIQAMGFVRDIEQSLASKKKEISRLEAKLNKASLMGPVIVFETSDS